MKVGADASQVPAIVRHIRGQKGGTWKEKVKAFQRSAGGLQVDGIVGPKTIAAMKRSDGMYEDNDYKQKATPTIDPLTDPGGKGRASRRTRQLRRQREETQKAHGRAAHKDIQNRLKQVTKDRSATANQNLNFLNGQELQRAIYERRRGGEKVVYKRSAIKPVSSRTSTGPQRPDYLGTPRSGTHHKSLEALLKNLNPSERAAFERWYQKKRG